MYQYRYKTTRGEYWKMSMYFIYHSMTGMVNLVFTAALIALTCAKWESSGTVFHICMVLGCCLFPILQPLAVYLSAGKLASGSGEDTEIRLDDVGIQVKVGNTYDKIPWRKGSQSCRGWPSFLQIHPMDIYLQTVSSEKIKQLFMTG